MKKAPQAKRRRFSRGMIGAALMLGGSGGLGIFTFGYGGGAAYLGSSPETCANCHVMQESYDTWQHSSHHAVATCNDCHLSHHPLGKWVTKADNGFFHSLAFTTGRFQDPLRIKPRNRRVTQAACLFCHDEFVHSTGLAELDSVKCVHCHDSVGHSQR